MARIELRHCDVILKDGFGGTAKIDDTLISSGNTTLEVNTIADLTNLSTVVPVGARFTLEGYTTKYAVTAQNANEKQQIVITATDGTYTLKLGASGDATDAIAYDAIAATVQAALVATDDFAVGDVIVSGTQPTLVFEFRGQYLGTNVDDLVADVTSLIDGGGSGSIAISTLRPGGTTWELTFTPAIPATEVPVTTDDVTFLPQELLVKVGEGNLSYTEHKAYDYLLDRGNLDTVREGNEVPMDVKLECTYEHITTGTSETIAVIDAFKGVGGAAGWVSSSSDLCEPYAVDLEVVHTPPCGGSDIETTLFPDLRVETKEVNFKDATINCTGKCNATEPVVSRTPQA